MVNAVMDAIALLSSLASDLDTMINDLRSAPSHATTATTATATATATAAATTAMPMSNHQQRYQQHQQQQQQQQHLQQMQSRQLQLNHWQNLQHHNNNNNHLPRPHYQLNDNNNKVKTAAAKIQIQTQTQTQITQIQQHRRRLPPKPLPRPPRRNRHGSSAHLKTTHNQNHHQPMDDEIDGDDTDASELANMTSPLSASASATRIMGLSPDVKKVQKLPLWCRHTGSTPAAAAAAAAAANRFPLGRSLHYQGMSEHTRGGGGVGIGIGIGGVAPATTIGNVLKDDDDASKVEVIVYTKSDKTLKQNMNAKDETLRKRTSLIIVPHQQQIESTIPVVVTPSGGTSIDNSPNENGNRNSIASIDSCVSTTTSQSNQSSTSSSNSSSSSGSDDHHHDAAAYQDLQNGNAESEHDNENDDAPQQLLLHSPAVSCLSSIESPSSSSSSSSSSGSSSSSSCASSVDYSLREQLKNFANLNQSNDEPQQQIKSGNDLPTAAQLLKGITGTMTMVSGDTLLSPQEVPLGRRYAEVAQFKTHHGKTRANELSSLPSAPLVATPTLETSSTSPVAVSCHISNSNNKSNSNNNNNNNNSNSSNNNNNNNNHNGQQSQKCQQQQHSTNLNSNSNSNNNSNTKVNNQKLNGPSNINNNSMIPANLVETVKKNIESLETDADAEDNIDSSHDADGAFEDDMQALLPQCARRSRDELSQSRTSLASEGGILAEGETSSEESSRDSSDNSPPCDLGLVERLLLTHPMWFLPGIQRSGAVHLLQGKEEGTFIVRGSSQPNTMAVSVRLPQDTGPYIEHYLIQSQDNVLSLESSRFKFGSIPSLIAHYAQCCDELPVQLMLPRVLREANNRKKLSSLALLGQEFWSYASSPAVLGPPIMGTTAKSSTGSTEQQLLDAKSPLSLTETSGLGTATFFSEATKHQQQHQHQHQQQHQQQQHQQQQQQQQQATSGGMPATGGGITPSSSVFSPTGSGQLLGFFSQAGTPSDTNSSMSSFSTSGGCVGGGISGGQHLQLLSPNSVDSVILTMSSPTMETLPSAPAICPNTNLMEQCSSSSVCSNNLSTFKTNAIENGVEQILQRSQRPKPPNTLNLKPPAPPLRWSKPHSPDQMANNFTVTTTVTFSMENGQSPNVNPNANQSHSNPPQFVEVTTPASSNPFNALLNGQSNTFQTFAKRLSPEGECKDTISSQGSSSTDSRWQSSQRKILSPLTPAGSNSTNTSNSNGKSRKSRARKESQHYQESDILESPQLQYCASALSDKISDYEDVWSHDPSDRATLLTSFKPGLDTVGGVAGVMNRRPDLLAETPGTLIPSEESLMVDNNNGNGGSQQLMQFSADAQPRSRAGLLLPNLNNTSNTTQATNEPDDGGDTTPTAAQTPGSRSKQGSPFYAEPADALRQAGLTNAAAAILRRQQRNQLLPATQRHSEPLKGGLAAAATSTLLLPAELEKLAAGSLDELKQKPQKPQATKRPRNRFENWQLDSSWEFMAKQHQETSRPLEYEHMITDWPYHQHKQQMEKENSLGRDRNEIGKKRPLTVHQIILKHLPDLNLPELVRCSTPPTTQTQIQTTAMPLQEKTLGGHGLGLSDGGSQKSIQSQNNGCRLSAYDNVERNCAAAFCQTYYGGIDSAQSDDGTVFSEPWDSTQWDSFMPQDDATINSDTIHLSKCRPALSEDDTIIEEYSSTKDGSQSGQDTLKANKTNNNNKTANGNRPKVATIVRNPSMRDREVLCHPRNKMNIQSCGPGDSLRAYTLQLAQDPSSTFSMQIENFISCTKESREAAPQVIMRNMRQFMSGMKNYLVKHGEGKFHSELETARARLKADEFLNLDAMLETVMHQLVVLPLREHLYGIFVDYYKRSEDIQLLAQNVRYACEREAADFGIRPTVTPPSLSALRLISNLLWRLQEAELPLDKLELFLCVISTVFDATGCPRGQQLGADDFLPVLVYVVAKCGFVGAEIEAEFMWGLLQPTLLNGEPGYYLTALCSAVQVLKTFMASEGESGSGSLDWRSSCLPACSSVLRVIIPDECNGSLQTRTLPVRPHTTTREVCRIIAHKARITNPQDYALFKLVDGEETLLTDAECPQDARLAAKGKHCMLAYKRIDAKIAWPTTATQSATSAGSGGH